ncbi:MAG: glycosyltransferase family 39 protein [Anaerolineae bacterium]|nr:glycosyltransferase family 39 protein [Anaerolineae bacterium]
MSRRPALALQYIPLVAILLLAGLLRLGWPGVNSFAFDEARLSLISLDMARGGQFAALGMPSSVGVPNLPAAAWVYSLPYVLSPDPLLATQFTGVLSLLTVAGTWGLARRAWGVWAATVAALLLAASPYAVLYSRSIWAQDLLPVLGLAWAWTAFLGAAQGRRWAIGAHVFLAGLAFQVHFAGAALILPTAYFFVRFRWWRYWLPVLIGGAVALLALLPFVMEVACCRPDILDQYRSALGGPAQIDLLGWAQLGQLALGLDWGFLLLGDLQPPDSVWVALIVAGLLPAGLITLIGLLIRARRVPEPPRESALLAEIVLAWLAASPLFFMRHGTPVWVHYHLAALPALALLAGTGTQLGQVLRGGTARQTSPWATRASPLPRGRADSLYPLSLTVLTLLVALAWSAQLAQGFDRAGQVETPNGLGTPLAATRRAAASVPEDLPVLFFTHGDNPAVDGEAAVFAALWWGRDYRIVQGDSLLILPPYPADLMATLRPIQAWEEIDSAGLIQAAQTFPRRAGAEPFMATEYDGATNLAGFTLLDTPIALTDGVQLEGWKARRVGPRLRISTLWRVLELPTLGTIQQFHHLRTTETLDAAPPLDISDVPLSAHRWQIGDRLVVMGDFFVDEASSFWVDVGHYTLPDLQRIPRGDGGDGLIRLGPFESTTTR